MNRCCLCLLSFWGVVSVMCLDSCRDEPEDSWIVEVAEPETTETRVEGTLTVEEARAIYEAYTTGYGCDWVNACRDLPLNPGWMANDWECAATSTAGANSYVSVPSQVSKNYVAKSPRNAEWVKVVQKLVVVQEDSTRRNNVYLLSIIPEGKYAMAYPEVIAEVCKGGDMPDDFSGLIVYTRLEGGMVVCAEWYQEGYLQENVFVFNANYSFEKNLEQLNAILNGYRVEEVEESMSFLAERGDWRDSREKWREQVQMQMGIPIVEYAKHEEFKKTITPEEVIRMLFGTWIDFFEKYFGYEFDISEFGL